MKSNKGFTMVELLVVLVIIGILAAVVTPILLVNSQKARASEAVGTLGLIRQALREHRINTNTYVDVANGDLPNTKNDPTNPGLEIDVGTTQYFSNGAFSVSTTSSSSNFTNPGPVDFVIEVDGNQSVACSGSVTDCSVKAGEVDDFRLEMDNSGRIMVSYNAGTTWDVY